MLRFHQGRSEITALLPLWVVLVLFALLLTPFILVLARARQRGAGGPLVSVPRENESAERMARERRAQEESSLLIERRVDLDARRGTLGGDNQLDAGLAALHQRFRSGQISEEEYESEKIRLLSE